MKRRILFSAYRWIFGVLACLLMLPMAYGQDEGSDLIEEEIMDVGRVKLGEIDFNIGFPQGAFGDKMNVTGAGIGLRYLWQTSQELPTFLGFEFAWMNYIRVTGTFQDVINNVVSEIEERTRLNMAEAHFLFRYYPEVNIPLIEPYFEGVAGIKVPFTTTDLEDLSTGDSFETEYNDGDVVFSYGASAGFHVNLKDHRWYLNTRFTYLLATSGQFITTDPIDSRELDDLILKNAPLEVARLQIGLTFAF